MVRSVPLGESRPLPPTAREGIKLNAVFVETVHNNNNAVIVFVKDMAARKATCLRLDGLLRASTCGNISNAIFPWNASHLWPYPHPADKSNRLAVLPQSLHYYTLLHAPRFHRGSEKQARTHAEAFCSQGGLPENRFFDGSGEH